MRVFNLWSMFCFFIFTVNLVPVLNKYIRTFEISDVSYTIIQITIVGFWFFYTIEMFMSKPSILKMILWMFLMGFSIEWTNPNSPYYIVIN